MQLPRHPQRLEVRDRAARRQVPEGGLGEPEHGGQLGDRLLLHLARHRPAVERVVVRVDEHRRDVSGGRDRVRRLEHLAREARVEEREVAVHPALELLPRLRPPRGVDGGRVGALAPARLPRLDEVERRLDAGPAHAPDHARRAGRALCAALRSLARSPWPAAGPRRPRSARRCSSGRRQPATSTALVWGLERPERAARRLRRHPAVAAATVLGRGVALLRSGRDGDGRVLERVRAGYAVPLDAIAVDPRGYAATVPPDGARRVRGAAARRGGDLADGGRAPAQRSGRRARAGRRAAAARGRRRRRRGAARRRDRGRGRRPARAAAAHDRGRGAAGADHAARARARHRARRRRADPAGRPARGGRADRPGAARAAEGPLRRAGRRPAVRQRLDPASTRRSCAATSSPAASRSSAPSRATGRCSRHLRAALAELSRRGLARLVDPGDYAGCYAPRRIQPRGQLSLHAWGVAVDLNASSNPFRGRSRQDPRLVRIMERHGFTWGGRWPTRPDPMHFELRGG